MLLNILIIWNFMCYSLQDTQPASIFIVINNATMNIFDHILLCASLDYFLMIQLRMKENWLISQEYIFRLLRGTSKLQSRNVPFYMPLSNI